MSGESESERLDADVAAVVAHAASDEYVIAGIATLADRPYLAGVDVARDKIRQAAGTERFDRLARAAELVRRRLPGHLSFEPLPVTVEWLCRHRPTGLRTAAETAADVAKCNRRWLLRGLWPADAYGALGGRTEAGKSLLILDLAVSVASGTPWFGQVPVDTAGPVVVYYAEGSRHELVRRGEAIAAARGLEWDELPILVTSDVPTLKAPESIDRVREALLWTAPALVVIDPLYVAAENVDGAKLFDFGGALRGVQQACQEADAALLLTHHLNAAGVLSGAGIAEWARVILIASADDRKCDPVTRRTDVTVNIRAQGNEIGGGTYSFRRSMWAEDPDDLQSPLTYRLSGVPVKDQDPGAVAEVVRLLEKHRVPVLASGNQAVQLLQDAGVGRHKSVVLAALKVRRDK